MGDIPSHWSMRIHLEAGEEFPKTTGLRVPFGKFAGPLTQVPAPFLTWYDVCTPTLIGVGAEIERSPTPAEK